VATKVDEIDDVVEVIGYHENAPFVAGQTLSVDGEKRRTRTRWYHRH
jgi:hypothetical protein